MKCSWSACLRIGLRARARRHEYSSRPRSPKIYQVEHAAQSDDASSSANGRFRASIFLRSRALVVPPRQPPNHRDHSHPSNRAHRRANFLVPHQQSPLPEQYGPVVVARTDQRQFLRPRIRHIRPDVWKILEEPKPAERSPCNLALPKEISGAKQRNNQLRQRPAHNHDRVAKWAEEWVPAFMNHQIRVVEKKEARAVPRGIHQKQKIKAQPANSRIPRNRLPLSEIFFQEVHSGKRNRQGRAGTRDRRNVPKQFSVRSRPVAFPSPPGPPTPRPAVARTR